jgi:hypothetical protein
VLLRSLCVVHEVSIYHAQQNGENIYMYYLRVGMFGVCLSHHKRFNSVLMCIYPGVSLVYPVSLCVNPGVYLSVLSASLCAPPMFPLCFQCLIECCGVAVCIAVSVCVCAYVPFPVSTCFKVQVLCQCVVQGNVHVLYLISQV